MPNLASVEVIASKILLIRDKRVMLDKDLAQLYGVETKRLPLEAIEKKIMSFSKEELIKQAEALRPFLFEEKDADLIPAAHTYIPSLIEKYKGPKIFT